jgi:hypothetical protein
MIFFSLNRRGDSYGESEKNNSGWRRRFHEVWQAFGNTPRAFRFGELTADKIAVLISHRFSTVRMADHIVVLKVGCITEMGSHEELLARGDTYARLFSLQAEGYR